MFQLNQANSFDTEVHLLDWCLVMVERLFLAVPWGCLRFVIVVFPDHTHLLFLDLSIRHDIDSSKIIDKRDGFKNSACVRACVRACVCVCVCVNFEIVNFLFLDGDVPRYLSYCL